MTLSREWCRGTLQGHNNNPHSLYTQRTCVCEQFTRHQWADEGTHKRRQVHNVDAVIDETACLRTVTQQILNNKTHTHTHTCTMLLYLTSAVAVKVAVVTELVKVKVKVHTLDIAPLRSESPPQKCPGMACVLKGFHNFTCTPTRSSAIGMIHTCLYLPSRSWYSFTDPGGMEGWVDLGTWYSLVKAVCIYYFTALTLLVGWQAVIF